MGLSRGNAFDPPADFRGYQIITFCETRLNLLKNFFEILRLRVQNLASRKCRWFRYFKCVKLEYICDGENGLFCFWS